jgi:RHS repeat-associated protein
MGEIRGINWKDLNKDGVFNPSESGLSNVTIYLDLNDNKLLDAGEPSTKTLADNPATLNVNETGQYVFTGLPAGTYTVRQNVPTGYVQTFPASGTGVVGDGFADVVLGYFDSGAGPIPGPYGETKTGIAPEPVNLNVVLGGDTGGIDFLSLPTGSFVTVGFTDETIIDAPGNDIFIRETGAAGERADVYISSNLVDFTLLGRAQDNITTALDLASIGFTEPVRAVKIVGLDNAGSSPGFDVVNVQVLPGSIGQATGTHKETLTQNQIVEGRNFGNFDSVDNVGNSLSDPRDIGLLIGTRNYSDSIGALDLYDIFRFELLKNSTFDLKLSGVSADADVSLLDSSGTQVQNTSAGSGKDGSIKVDLTAGIYYIRVLRFNSDSTLYTLTVTGTPKPVPFQIVSVTPDKGSNAGQTTISIKGAQFTPDTKVNIIDPSGKEALANQVTFQDDSTLSATFNLAGLVPGAYDVRVTDKAGSAAANDVFQVNSTPPGKLEVFVSAPGGVRPWATGEVVVTYRNAGGTDIPAPLLTLTADGANFEQSGEFNNSNVEFLGINKEGNAGILAPGASGTYRSRFKPKDGVTDINFKVNSLSTGEIVDWNTIKDSSRPESIPADAWNVIFNNFTTSIGNKAGDFQAVLDENATRLSQLGEYTGDVSRLLAFELLQANSQAISKRSNQGAFGRGNTNPFNINATTDSSGNVTIGDGSILRLFQKQKDGTYRSQTGDYATLTKEGDVYRLREKGGGILNFRTDGKLDFILDPNNNKVTTGYINNKLTSLTYSNGDKITFTYNDKERISEVIDQFGQKTIYTYDATGERLLSVTDTSGTTSYTYETGGAKEYAIKSITYPDATKTVFDYDAQGRLIKQTFDNGAEAETYTYDSAGGVTLTDANGKVTKLLLNDKGEISQSQDALGRVTQFRYDNSNLTRLIAPGNSISAFTYDNRGNLLSSVDPLGQRVDFSYDSRFDQLNTVRDQRGNTTRYNYDNKSNLSSITYVDNSSETFSYNDKGELTVLVNRRSQEIKYTYDSRGLLTKKLFADGTSATFEYDSQGNLAKATDADSSVAYAYDNANRLTKVTYGAGRFLEFSYDAGDRRTKMVDQDGFTTNYIYNNAGRLKQLTDKSGANIVTYSYDNVGRLAREDNGNSTYTTYGYDDAGQLLSLVNSKADSSVNSRFDYTYDNLGHRTSTTTLEGKTTYGYDATDQLTSVTLPGGRVIEYSYDVAGNRISVKDNGAITAYSTNNLNQYTNVGGGISTYDKDGNLISKTEGGKTTTFTYDIENRLIRTVTPEGTWNYEYDALGNRIASTNNGQRTEYLLDPTGLVDVVGEYSSGGVVARYTHGLGLVSRFDANNATSFYDADAIGSTVGLTGAGGNYLNRYNYLPFGEDLSKTETVANPFQYVGQWGVMNEGNGIDFIRARYYLPLEGRFTSRDPIGISGGLNLYGYVQNDPINFVDLSGTSWGRIIIRVAKGLRSKVRGNNLNTLGNSYKESFENIDELVNALKREEIDFAIVPKEVQKELYKRGFKTYETEERIFKYDSGHYHESDPLTGARRIKGKVKAAAHVLVNKLHSIAAPLTASYWANDLFPDNTFAGVAGEIIDLFNPLTLPNDLLDLWELLDDTFTEIRTSFDPNDIIGPAGFGTERWLVPNQTLPYTIRFENLAAATAPAVFVTITQQLDPDLNFSTFELGDFGFRNINIKVPDGRKNHVERLDLRDTIGYFVDVEGGINPSTGELKWTLKAIDPITGELPTDVKAGFLPPNNAQRDGEGYVSYRIQPKAGLTSGTALDARASIVFDTNAPINTPLWQNKVDLNTPTSTVTLPATTPGKDIKLTLSGSDDGSGIASYDIFASVDGSPFTLWQDNITATEATYTGEIGKTYSFYTVATDNVGRTEEKGAISQASTKLVPVVTNPSLKQLSSNIFQIEGASSDSDKPKLQATLTGRNSNLVNELGVFVVDDANGTINGIAPGQPGYNEAALSKTKVIFSSISNIPNGFNPNDLSRTLEFTSGQNMRLLLVKNSTIDSVSGGKTPVTDVLFSSATTQKVTDNGNGKFTLGWEDTSGTADFKDLVVEIQSSNQQLPMGTNLQGASQAELIDLRSVDKTKSVKADFILNREAAYNNFVGFYQIADETGGIDTNNDGKVDLRPGNEGYIKAAVGGRVSGIDLSVNNQGTANFNGTLKGGGIFAPFLIVDGRADAVLDADTSNDPQVYFAYLGANTDKVDHIRLLGNNTFGFEDLVNGGDNDYNDVIIKANLAIA